MVGVVAVRGRRARAYELRVELPGGTEHVRVYRSFPDLYGDPPNNNGGVIGFDVDPFTFVGIGMDVLHLC